MGSKYLQFIPMWRGGGQLVQMDLNWFIPEMLCGVTNWSFCLNSGGHFLNSIFDEWVQGGCWADICSVV
jgi:hypothetical protein